MTRSTAQPCPVVVYNSPTVLKLFKQTPHCLFYKKKNSIENMHFSVSSMISTLGLILSKAENLIIASLQIDIIFMKLPTCNQSPAHLFIWEWTTHHSLRFLGGLNGVLCASRGYLECVFKHLEGVLTLLWGCLEGRYREDAWMN